VDDAGSLPGPGEGDDLYDDAWQADHDARLPCPPWWRWVAIVLIVALVVATPFAYALYRWVR